MIRLTRWGNSTGVRIAATLMEAAGLKVGDYVHVRLLDSGDIRVRPFREPLAADRQPKEDQKVEEEPW